ncbi:FAD-binding oxidoreductase [Pseudomonas putida]|uniref:FAD-binding oxidoreductase n=1 Tax=Pseudomonas putida TaxID=303 RepID=UPI0027569857|nr:FAD-binding oxidoreductase [Pseudomonas putida]MDP9522898.1 FAD-binding oxidoreductase [Pseudomonas putida]
MIDNTQLHTISESSHILTRRHLLQAGMTGIAVSVLSPWSSWAAPSGVLVNDVTMLNPIWVNRLFSPRTTGEIQRALAMSSGPVSIGGGRYSMGGQIATEDSLHLDMRQFNQVIRYSPENRVIRVQTGIRWRDLQSVIDPDDLSIKIMQSYANFTVGGSLSVNAHGRYVGAGPVINSVRSLQLVLADASVVEASRTTNSDLFYAAIGGYGAMGVITEVELDLVSNITIERQIHRMPVADYPSFFNDQVRENEQAILHNADLPPPYFDIATSVTWRASDKELTVAERLVAPGQSFKINQAIMWSVTKLPGGPMIRKDVIDPLRYFNQPVVRRNYEASADVASLGPIATRNGTYALQEYFVPVAQFNAFVKQIAAILRAHRVDAVNISIRHAPADPDSFMSWAREEVFSFVLYYWQRVGVDDREEVGIWTRELINAALLLGGTYYLPYQLHATQEQFSSAYPNARRLLALKAQVDPGERFRNKLWDKYRTG